MKAGGNTFDIDYQVEYSDIDCNHRMKASRAIDCFQQLATLHSAKAGYDVKTLSEMGLGWILTHWHVKFRRIPVAEERLVLSTWSAPRRRIQAQRDFAATDEKGEEIIYATSMWAIMNLKTRWPWRMEKGFYDSYLLEDSREICEETFPKLKASELSEFITPDTEMKERFFTVSRRDTDTNRHVNNIIYIDWAFDDVPDEIYDVACVSDVRVLYIKECRKGARVRSTFCVKRTSSGYEAVSVFSDGDDASLVFAEVWSTWEI